MNSSKVHDCDNPDGIFMLWPFMEWLEDNYIGFDNSLMREITHNAICYILEFGDEDHYIDDINSLFDCGIDALPFFRDSFLSEDGISEKKKFWEENHPTWWDKNVDDADYWYISEEM